MSEVNDLKRALLLDVETGNKVQSKIKRLKGTKRAYARHITKTISRINTLMSEPNNVCRNGNCLQDQLKSLVTKLKTVLDTLIGLSDLPEEVFVYNKLHFEQKEQVFKLKCQILIYISGNSLESASQRQFFFHKACKLPR